MPIRLLRTPAQQVPGGPRQDKRSGDADTSDRAERLPRISSFQAMVRAARSPAARQPAQHEPRKCVKEHLDADQGMENHHNTSSEGAQPPRVLHRFSADLISRMMSNCADRLSDTFADAKRRISSRCAASHLLRDLLRALCDRHLRCLIAASAASATNAAAPAAHEPLELPPLLPSI